MPPRFRPVTGLSIVVALALVACTGGGSPAPSPSPLPSPSPSPGPEFTIDVSPPELPLEIRMLLPGEESSFLVRVSDLAPGAGAVVISATAEGATITEIIQPTPDKPVGAVWLVPAPATEETTGSITITAGCGTATTTVERTFKVFPMADERGQDARPHFERWIDWLIEAHPELGIDEATEWQPRFVSTLLIVSHYAYYSDEWELTIAWHNMIPPDDWSEIHLRHRGVDLTPSLAFRQDSMANETEPHAVTPPEVVVR
ncbi:MAG: hypothetical protein FIA92_17665 [Chloroflexi bacterium]|nr:hypothetical protein [Chloroflexota bacterium]